MKRRRVIKAAHYAGSVLRSSEPVFFDPVISYLKRQNRFFLRTDKGLSSSFVGKAELNFVVNGFQEWQMVKISAE
jgi:hypothetical protein